MCIRDRYITCRNVTETILLDHLVALCAFTCTWSARKAMAIGRSLKWAFRGLMLAITLYLWISNGYLLVGYMLG